MINQDYFIANVAALAVGTIFIRGSFIFLLGKMVLSHRVKQLFTYIPPAILPALVIPTTFFHSGSIEIIYGKERFLILLLAVIVSFFVRNTLFTICFGLAGLYLLKTFF